MFDAFISGFFLSAGLIVAIGAQNAFVLRQGVRREFVPMVVALCAAGDIICITLGVAGVGGFISSRPLLLFAATWLGVLFLSFYGYLALRRVFATASHGLVTGVLETPQSWQRVLAMCLAFTFLNPHVYLDTVVLLGSISSQYQERAGIFGMGAGTASIVWFSALGFGARFLSPYMKSARSWKIFDSIVAVIMFALVISLLRSPWSAWPGV